MILVAFMLLIGLAAITLLFVKGPDLIAAWRAGSPTAADRDMLAQLARIESDIGTLKRALITESEEGLPTATSRKLAADLAARLDRIEALVKAEIRRRK